MTDNFKEIGSLFGREGAGAGFAKQTDKESFTYAFAWPEGDTWATLTGYLNLDEQPEEYVRRVLQDGGFRSDWGNPDYDPIGDFKETAGDEYRIPLLKVLLREQLESRYEVANHFSTMNRARVELSAFIQNEGGAPLPEDALGTPEEQGIRAMLIATGEPPREVTLLPDKNGSTLKPLQALVGGNIETFDIAFGEEVSLYVNEEGLFTCPPNRAIFATEKMAKAGYLSQLDYSKVVEMRAGTGSPCAGDEEPRRALAFGLPAPLQGVQRWERDRPPRHHPAGSGCARVRDGTGRSQGLHRHL